MHDERWKTLCEKASNEHDPQKLLELVQQILDLLDQKYKRSAGPDVTWPERGKSPGNRETN